MSKKFHGEIAALEYHDPPDLGFPDIVEEFDIATNAFATQVRGLTWDGEDIAIIDRETVRIALGWLPPERPNRPHYLVIAIGPPAQKGRRALDQSAYELLVRRAIERVRGYLPYDAKLLGPATQPVDELLLDRTFELLTATAPETDTSDRQAGRAKARDAKSHDWAKGAMDASDARDLPKQISVPMRLTIITFGLTLFLHAPPIGAALLTYTTLREAQPLMFG
ncbi:hypothetical protein [uncultured Roseovarius sp.]|uniref:hypothetical protein n=1 Tax=uncultured Roseovarius sp. TaxID=293344 RepID=UPI00262B38F1|nr:hypothetical protein [uncultured Roseovarius sp.]